MSLESEFGAHSTEDIERFGKRLVDRYGGKACRAAEQLNDTNLSEDSISSYKPSIRQVVARLNDDNPKPERVVEAIVESDKEAGSKAVAVNAWKRYFKVIGEESKAQKLHDIAKKQGLDEVDFSSDMEVNEWLTNEEIERIRDSILPDVDENIKHIEAGGEEWVLNIEYRALFDTIHYTGNRIGEVMHFQVSDIYFDSQEIKTYRSKKKGEGLKRDMIIVPEELLDVLEVYLERNNIEEGDIFPFTKRTAQNRIADINEVYKFLYGDFEHAPKLKPHTLRHTRVTEISNESDIEKASQFVDHSSVKVTEAYRHLATEQQKDFLPEFNEDSEETAGIQELLERVDADSVDELVEMLDEQ